MKKIENKERTMNRGFTLVELVIVIVILGILAAVAIPKFANTSDDAKIAKASAIFGSLKASYAVQSAILKGVVPVSKIIADHDPSCSPADSLTVLCGNADVEFMGLSTAVTPPGKTGALWTCKVKDVGDGTTVCPP